MLAEQVVSACQHSLAATRFCEQFRNDFLPKLYAWCDEHRKRVRACYIPVSPTAGCIKVFVVTASAKFDFELSDLIAELELEMDRKTWNCDILQVGVFDQTGLETFFDPQNSIMVYGDGDN